MTAATGKVAGVVNGVRSELPSFPENISAFKTNLTRPITTIISDTPVSTVHIQEHKDRDDVGHPLPRLVFGGPPTLDEAIDATSELRSALDQAYLSNESCGGSYVSDAEHNKLDVSDSAPKNAIQAYRLIRESTAVQKAVASIASDPKVYYAVMNNEALLAYIKSKDPGYQSPKHFDNEPPPRGGIHPRLDQTNMLSTFMEFMEEEPKYGFNSFLENIKVGVLEMMNRVCGFFQNLFAGPRTADESALADKTVGASIMGLALMVIMIVVFKRV